MKIIVKDGRLMVSLLLPYKRHREERISFASYFVLIIVYVCLKSDVYYLRFQNLMVWRSADDKHYISGRNSLIEKCSHTLFAFSKTRINIPNTFSR